MLRPRRVDSLPQTGLKGVKCFRADEPGDNCDLKGQLTTCSTGPGDGGRNSRLADLPVTEIWFTQAKASGG